ncbi:flagellar basal-body MS-ring/collar protein FliF [Oceanirhabdus seepicola]|uniref:Flagellar M-ring protein n=1 Tax=Oceanirhabdus seepicola TaxID=2828781 RepID=A0A9J6P9V5_9CLOT|nr:flagellar basal-body MS-ring/collar protein FliF [Oceanirhabdus seepicola]MCM1992646.1 flagellar M-ring protein FliF [Oceanirhabdus seepicola]
MNKLMEAFKKGIARFNGLSKAVKISIGMLTACTIIALVYGVITMTRTEYSVLFANMTDKDSGVVVRKLEEENIIHKVEGDKILVEKSVAAATRMKILSEVKLSDNTSSFDIILNSKSMVSTEFENNVAYQVALQNEIRSSIKSFYEVEDAKVILVIPEQSGFARETKPASASIRIDLKDGVDELSKGQVKTIVALVSKSVENLPPENIVIAVDELLLVTEDGSKKDGDIFSSDEQESLKKSKEKTYEDKIYDMLKETFGTGGVRVAVNLDMNFDATKTESIDYKEGVIVSEKNTINTSTKNENDSSSPVDDNMSNIGDNSGNSNSTSSQDQVKNYNVPQVKEVVVKSPGKVEKITVSILVDKSLGALDSASEKMIRNMAAGAVGFDAARGDTISVASMNFINNNKDIMDQAEKVYLEQQVELARQRLIRNIAIAIGGVILLITILSILKRMKKKEKEAEIAEMEGIMSKDIEISENGEPITKVKEFAPIDFEEETEQEHITNEVKKYAQDKPEQVVEIIKSWLAEDERG